MLKADANGLPIDATNTDTDVADAVTKKHSQNTDTGTTATTFTLDSDAVLGKIALTVAAGAADKTLTLTNAALTDNRTITFPDLTGTVVLADAGNVVFNEAGADYDFRIEGVGVTHALFVQGSDGFVGLGLTPLARLDVNETIRISRVTSGNNMDLDFYNPIATAGLVARIRGDGDSLSNTYGALSFWTTQTPDSLVERMRVTSAGLVGLGETTPGTLFDMASTAPYLTIHNTTHEDGAGGREGKLIFEGEQSGTELSTLGEIEFSHDGASDDEKGKMVIRLNDGNDGTSPTAVITALSSGYVGIGCTPRYKFEVSAGSGTYFYGASSSSVAHGITDVLPTDVFYGHFLHASLGNFKYHLSGGDFNPCAEYAIFGTDNPTDTIPAWAFVAGKKSGTSVQALAATETCFQIFNWGTALLTLTGDGTTTLTGNFYPGTDNTYYLGKNDDDSPLAWKGIIMKDTTNGKYYRAEVINGVLTATDLTD
jgi:hypothetical protein